MRIPDIHVFVAAAEGRPDRIVRVEIDGHEIPVAKLTVTSEAMEFPTAEIKLIARVRYFEEVEAERCTKPAAPPRNPSNRGGHP